MIAAPAAPSGLRQMRYRSRAKRPCAVAPALTSSASKSSVLIVRTSALRIFDARVEDGIEHVDREIDEHDDRGHEHHEILHDRVVALSERRHEVARDSGHVENGFGND